MNTIQEEQTPCPEIEPLSVAEDDMKITSMYFQPPMRKLPRLPRNASLQRRL